MQDYIMSIKVVGLCIETYVQKYLEGHNCDFETKQRDAERYFLFCENDEGKKLKLTLDEDYENECYSGWTEAVYGLLQVDQIDEFPTFHKVPVKLITFNLSNCEDDVYEDINCDAFEYSHNGRDDYYPNGCSYVKLDNFVNL